MNLVTGNGMDNTLSSTEFPNGAPSATIVADSTVAVGELVDFSFVYSDDNNVIPAEKRRLTNMANQPDPRC